MGLFAWRLAFAFAFVQGRPSRRASWKGRAASSSDIQQTTGFISLEEHWVSPAFTELFGVSDQLTALTDVGPDRIAKLDEGGIAIQLISHNTVSAPESMFMNETVAQANTELAAAVAQFPDRLKGLCMLPMGQPEAAAAELPRCINELGFPGALVDTHIVTPEGNFLFFDGPAYDVLWEAATALDVPIYLHPRNPPDAEFQDVGTGIFAPAVQGGYSSNSAGTLSTTGWGWHEAAGLSFIKLWLGGVFDRHPTLKIVIGHYGEMLPYWLWRADTTLSANANRTATLRETFHRNLWITTSAIFSLEPMYTLLNVVDIEHILYSVDYPYASNANGRAFFENEFRPSGLVTEEEYQAIAHGNAEKLLRLN